MSLWLNLIFKHWCLELYVANFKDLQNTSWSIHFYIWVYVLHHSIKYNKFVTCTCMSYKNWCCNDALYTFCEQICNGDKMMTNCLLQIFLIVVVFHQIFGINNVTYFMDIEHTYICLLTTWWLAGWSISLEFHECII